MIAIATQTVLHDLSLVCSERVLMSKFNDFSNSLGEFFPHLGRCAEHVGLSKRQIQRIIVSLLSKHKIEKTGKKHRETWDIYRLCPDNADTATTTTGGDDIGVAPPRHGRRPDIEKEIKIIKNNKPSGAKPEKRKAPVVSLSESEKVTFEQLKAKGIKGKVAIKLIKQQGAKACAQQLSHLAWQQERGYTFTTSIAAWLCAAIRENWDLPKAMSAPKDTFATRQERQAYMAQKQTEVLAKLSTETTPTPNDISTDTLARLTALAHQRAERDANKYKSFGVPLEVLAKEYLRQSIEAHLNTPKIKKRRNVRGVGCSSKARMIAERLTGLGFWCDKGAIHA